MDGWAHRSVCVHVPVCACVCVCVCVSASQGGWVDKGRKHQATDLDCFWEYILFP